MQPTDHQTRSLGDRKQRQLVGDHVSKVETDWPEWLGRIKKEDRQIRQMSLQLAWKSHRQHFLLPRMLQQNLLRTEAGGKQFIHSFSEKTRIAKYADARKLRERHAEEILTIGRTEFKEPIDSGI